MALGRCLAAHSTHLPQPTLDELGLGWIRKVCDRLWVYRSADFEPDITVPLHESQWRETCALAGSIAESLMLAAANLVEIEWHERALRQKTEPAGMVLGQRYLADTACETSIAVGHRLINLVAPVLRTDPRTRQRMTDHRLLAALGSSPGALGSKPGTRCSSIPTDSPKLVRGPRWSLRRSSPRRFRSEPRAGRGFRWRLSHPRTAALLRIRSGGRYRRSRDPCATPVAGHDALIPRRDTAPPRDRWLPVGHK